MESAEKSLQRLRERIEIACRNCGRDIREITLIGASKAVSSEKLREFHAAGLRAVGENYVQEATRKQREIAQDESVDSSTRCAFDWHFIGALQSNKACEIVGKFVLIHSVDRTRLAQALSDEARKKNVVQAILLQVNLGDEASKAGCAIDELPALWNFCAELPGLKVRGLMCLPPASQDAEQSRVYFRRMRELREQMRASSTRLSSDDLSYDDSSDDDFGGELSMGMSGDYAVAIEEGATMIRVGTALFGARV